MIRIIHELRIAKGTNNKKKILRRHSDNEDWKAFLRSTYDTSINYYTSSPQDTTFVSDPINMNSFLSDLYMLASRKYTGNAAKAHAIRMSREYGELARLALNGSIDAGVSTTLINDAYPGLIPEFKVMLARDIPVTSYPILGSTKYDGVRLLAFVREGSTELVLRSGKQIFIESLVNAFSFHTDGVYDGELVAGDGKLKERTGITGSVNKCLKGTMDDIDNYSFMVFDYVTHDDWQDQESKWTYENRYNMIKGMPTNSKVKVADQVVLHNKDIVESLYAERIRNGYEGLILRYPEDPYVWDRSNLLIKKKAITTGVVECVGYKEGTGKYTGMIGSLLCKGVVEGKEVVVNIGSGMSDYDREKVGYYEGKKIEVLYNSIVSDGKGFSLFLPRFKRILGDKNV
jgi:DNA ligase 1